MLDINRVGAPEGVPIGSLILEYKAMDVLVR
jgi:hypothetical protein